MESKKKKKQQMNKHKGNRVIDTEKQQVWDGRKKKMSEGDFRDTNFRLQNKWLMGMKYRVKNIVVTLYGDISQLDLLWWTFWNVENIVYVTYQEVTLCSRLIIFPKQIYKLIEVIRFAWLPEAAGAWGWIGGT